MIANFKRVKGLTKEVSVVTEALKGSSMLAVDEEGSRVRRTTPLPAYDTTDICRRTLVAEHLPDKPTIGEAAEPWTVCFHPHAIGSWATPNRAPGKQPPLAHRLHAGTAMLTLPLRMPVLPCPVQSR